jgi:ABC-type ATPase with predicted acetyltransferase domain
MRDELGVRLEEHVELEVWDRMQVLRKISARLAVDEAAYWKSRVAKYSALNDEELETLADLEPYHPKHNPDPDTFLECSNCGEETVVQMPEDPDIGVCTNKECREVSGITFCLRCGERLTDGTDLCDGCDSYIDSQ